MYWSFITPLYPPNNTEKMQLLLEGIDSIIEQSAITDKNISTAYFGATAVSVGNALQLRKDSIFTQGITVLFIIVFLAFYFKKKTGTISHSYPGCIWGFVFAGSYLLDKRKHFGYCAGHGVGSIGHSSELLFACVQPLPAYEGIWKRY